MPSFDLKSIERMMDVLQSQANQSGDTQTVSASSGGWIPVIKDGKKVGRMRFAMMDITITPKKKPKRKAKRVKSE